MSDFFLKVAVPTSGIPKKVLRALKDAPYVYFYQEKEAFKAKAGPRKKDRYIETYFWMILSSKPIKDFERRKWRET